MLEIILSKFSGRLMPNKAGGNIKNAGSSKGKEIFIFCSAKISAQS